VAAIPAKCRVRSIHRCRSGRFKQNGKRISLFKVVYARLASSERLSKLLREQGLQSRTQKSRLCPVNESTSRTHFHVCRQALTTERTYTVSHGVVIAQDPLDSACRDIKRMIFNKRKAPLGGWGFSRGMTMAFENWCFLPPFKWQGPSIIPCSKDSISSPTGKLRIVRQAGRPHGDPCPR
jgi:hypothetical protein